MKKRTLVCALIFLAVLVLAIGCAAAESLTDYENAFQDMSLEELVPIQESLNRIINEKRIEGAVLLIDPAEGRVATGRTLKLTVSSDGREISNKTKITYESSDETIAKVSNGTITGVSEGKAVIKVSAVFEDEAVLEASAEIEVYVPVTALRAQQTATVFAGDQLDLNELVTVSPENATEKRVVFEVDDPEAAEVDANGGLKGLKGGKVTVTVTSAEETDQPKTAKITVNVNQAVSAITLSDSSFQVGKGKSYTLEATIGPEDATDKSLTWTSEDPTIASVSNTGVVSGKKGGKTKITCTAKDGSGVTATADVTVITAVNSISFQKKAVAIIKGHTKRCEVTINPSDASNKSLKWYSSNTAVATVSDNGTITGKAKGSCTITADAQDGSGVNASITVYVEPDVPVTVESIHWQTTWGVKNGKMGVYGTNHCGYRKVKSFDYTVECSSWYGNGATSYQTYSGPTIAPGKQARGKLSRSTVSGFSSADRVSITVTSVTFDDGETYNIPTALQETVSFAP